MVTADRKQSAVQPPMVPILAASLLALSALAQNPTATAQDPAATLNLKGRVVAYDGTPISGCCAALRVVDTCTTADVLKQPDLQTGADGRFALAYPRPPGNNQARTAWLKSNKLPVLLLAANGRASLQISITLKSEQVANEEVRYADETDLGDIVMADGARLFGRVRDAAGKPLAGARIVATDLLEGSRFFRGSSRGYRCVADSDDGGVFVLPCALGQAARVQCSLDGWYQETRQPVATTTPLEFTLQPSGVIRGRVLDKSGGSVADALVWITYETAGQSTHVTTGADGSFTRPIAHRGRWRLRATKTQDEVALEGRTEPFSGTRENLEIVLAENERNRRNTAGKPLPVRAKAKADGKPVTEFRAVAIWQQYANQNANYREYLLDHQMRWGKQAKDGVASVPGPNSGDGTTTGAVRVLAAGFAPCTVVDHEYKEPEEGKEPEPLTVELVPEARISGVLRDETSNEPIAGAKVSARLRQDPNLGIYNNDSEAGNVAVTAADGTFSLGQLGEGDWDLICKHEKRPSVPPQQVTLAAAEHKQGMVVTMPLGATVAGRLVGVATGRGWKVFLHRLPRFAMGNMYYGGGRVYYGNEYDPPNSVEVDAEGRFQIHGVKLDNYLLVLTLPSQPRCGSNLFVPLEPFRVRKEGVQREIDLGQDQPGRINGSVAFPGAAVTAENLVVVAQQIQEEGQQFWSPWDVNYQGQRSLVDVGGNFSVQVGPGSYMLRLVDVGTGVCLAVSEKPVVVEASAAVQTALTAQLFKVKVTLQPEDGQKEMALAQRLELRVQAKKQNNNNNGVIVMGGNENYDTGVGLEVPPGVTELELVLPESQVQMFLRSSYSQLLDQQERQEQRPLGRADFEVSTTPEKNQVAIKVVPPPELAGDKPAEGNDADGVKK